MLSLLGNLSGGYFVDLAANMPACGSNTYTMETWFGWRGLCVEGNPAFLRPLRRHRSCAVVHTAVDDAPGRTVRFRVDNWGLGGIVANDTDNRPDGGRGKTVTLRTRTLTEIFDTLCVPATIDYLSLDVEGAELRVLRNFSFHRYQFRVLTVERPPSPLRDLLRRRGYVFLRTLAPYGEELWVHRSLYVHRRPHIDHVLAAYRPANNTPCCSDPRAGCV